MDVKSYQLRGKYYYIQCLMLLVVEKITKESCLFRTYGGLYSWSNPNELRVGLLKRLR